MAVSTGAAILGGTLGSAAIGGIGAHSAARAGARANRNALNLQREMFQTARQDLQPFTQAGVDAIGQLRSVLGLDGGDQQAAVNALGQRLEASPDFQFALGQGLNALDRSASSRGRLFSGGQTQAVQQFGQGLASQNLNNFLNRLTGIAGLGQASAAGQAASAQNFGTQGGNTLQNIGAFNAAGRLGVANALSQPLGDIGFLAGADALRRGNALFGS